MTGRKNNSSAHESSLIICAVQSITLWGEGRLKKWTGECCSVAELRCGIKTSFALKDDFELQYLDRDVSEYIDLEDYVFQDFKSQQYKLVRLVFPQSRPHVNCKEDSKTFSSENRTQQIFKKDSKLLKTTLINSRKEEIELPRSVRTCRKKAISYAELSTSSPITDTAAAPCDRVLFQSPERTIAVGAGDSAASLANRLYHSHITPPSAHAAEEYDKESDDDSDPLRLDSLGLGPNDPFGAGNGPPLFQPEVSGPPSTTDANSLGASPTIPDGLTPLPPRRLTPRPQTILLASRSNAQSTGVAEPATPRHAIKQLRFELPDDDCGGSGNDGLTHTWAPQTPAGFRAVTPTPDRHRGVGCALDAKTGLFQTARKPGAAGFATPLSPAISGAQTRTPIRSDPSARRTLFPLSPRAEASEAQKNLGLADGDALKGRAFQLQREVLARDILDELNAGVFGGQLPADLEIRWSGAYTRTAGMTSFKLRYCPDEAAEGGMRVEHTAAVELSSKVRSLHPRTLPGGPPREQSGKRVDSAVVGIGSSMREFLPFMGSHPHHLTVKKWALGC